MFNWNIFDQEAMGLGFIILFMLCYGVFQNNKRQTHKNKQNLKSRNYLNLFSLILLTFSPLLINLFLLIINTLTKISSSSLINFVFWMVPPTISIGILELLRKKIKNKINSNNKELSNSNTYSINTIIKSVNISNIIILIVLSLFLVDILINLDTIFLVDTAFLRIGLLYGYLTYIFCLNGVISENFQHNFDLFKDNFRKHSKKVMKYAFFVNILYYIFFYLLFFIMYLINLSQNEWSWIYASGIRTAVFSTILALGGVNLILYIWYFGKKRGIIF